MTEFFQNGPHLTNTYESDLLLRSYVKRKIPVALRASLEGDYRRLGDRAAGDIAAWGALAESEPPRHIPYDAWGKRVDRIEVSRGWQNLDRISAEEGLIATGYERKNGALSRIDQFIRLHLFGPSSAIYSCPLAMTDGAARAIEIYGDDELKKNAYQHLISRDPRKFWTSGQWMTERTGGSDVSGTSTIAKKDGDSYRLYGTKWFTSATTSQMAMTLARIEGSSAGGAGLSLFYVELRDTDGNLRNIRVNRLKDKLGTRALPTAELTLEGTPAKLVGTPGEGVKKISSLFNITRIYNSCMSAAGMGRAIVLARDYSKKRFAFGKPLSEHPLHVETLAAMELEYEAAFLLTFRAVELLGKEETEGSTREESAILRLLTPIVKLYTAKQGIAVASEALECFGGAGYVEDTGLPSLLRDAQVLAIWEGTTNVLSLDMIRAIEKEKALEPYLADLGAKTSAIREPRLGECAKKVLAALETLRKAAAKLEPVRARAFAFTLARATCAALLLEHAERCAGTSEFEKYVDSALRWCEQDLTSTLTSRRLGL